MKVLLLNGSPRKDGNTAIALSEVAKTLQVNGIETEIVSIGTKAVQGCIACGKCSGTGRCVFNDSLYNEVREKIESADGLVVGSPVYYAGPNGSLCALLDRLLSFIFSILLFIFLIINALLNMILVFQFMAFQQCYIKDEQFCL